MRDCDNCKHRDVWTYAEPCSKCHALSEWEEEKQTNGDKVRRATDEELVDLWYFIYHTVIFNSTDSRQGLLQWLKQEVQDAAD